MAKLSWVLKRVSVGVLSVAAIAYFGLLGLLYFGQRDMIYHPTDLVPEPAAYGVPEMVARRVESSGGARPLIWWAPPRDPRRPVIVYFHGNAGHLGLRGDRARAYMRAGYGVLLAGYRYNAGAGGEPSEEGLLADGHAAVAFARDKGFGPDRIVFYGESLGSGVATAMAMEYGAAALVLEMPYSSVADVAQAHYWYLPVRWLVKDQFDSVARIPALRAPVLILHGEDDPVIPVWTARRLFAAAPEPKEAHFFEGGTHGNLYRLGAAKLVLDFLGRHTSTSQITARSG
jgi:fermentation-respiration switch protein FrsA (DUF1100 family)